MSDITRATERELLDFTQGCRETTCLYHGEANAELQRRRTENRNLFRFDSNPAHCDHAPEAKYEDRAAGKDVTA